MNLCHNTILDLACINLTLIELLLSILFDENMHIKLTDFGTAKLLDEDDPADQQNATEDSEEGEYCKG